VVNRHQVGDIIDSGHTLNRLGKLLSAAADLLLLLLLLPLLDVLPGCPSRQRATDNSVR
jgi:hypothetical protein